MGRFDLFAPSRNDGVDGAPNGIDCAKLVVVRNPSEEKPSMGKSIRNFAAVTRWQTSQLRESGHPLTQFKQTTFGP